MYMPNAKTQRQGPNATYIPLAGVGGWRRGQCKFKFGVGGLESGNAKKLHQLTQNIPTCWYILRRVHCPTPTPDARYFAFWWNIGLRVWVEMRAKVSIPFTLTGVPYYNTCLHHCTIHRHWGGAMDKVTATMVCHSWYDEVDNYHHDAPGFDLASCECRECPLTVSNKIITLCA